MTSFRQRFGAWVRVDAASVDERQTPDWQAMHHAAQEAQAEGDLARAGRLFQQAAELNQSASVFHDWAELLQLQGRQDAAIEKYLVVLSLDPERASAYDSLSQLFQRKGADLQYNWGRILERRGELAQADAFYRRTIELAPDSQLAARANRRLATLSLLSLSAAAVASARGASPGGSAAR